MKSKRLIYLHKKNECKIKDEEKLGFLIQAHGLQKPS